MLAEETICSIVCPASAWDMLRDVFLCDDRVERHADDTKRIEGAKFLDGFFEKSLHHGTRSIDKRGTRKDEATEYRCQGYVTKAVLSRRLKSVERVKRTQGPTSNIAHVPHVLHTLLQQILIKQWWDCLQAFHQGSNPSKSAALSESFRKKYPPCHILWMQSCEILALNWSNSSSLPIAIPQLAQHWPLCLFHLQRCSNVKRVQKSSEIIRSC